MGGKRIWCLSFLLLVFCSSLVTSSHVHIGKSRRRGEKWFLLKHSRRVVKTSAGSMSIVKSGAGGKFMRDPLYISFITMEPKSLFVPQYLDSSMILFVRQGEARVVHTFKDELVDKTLNVGDVYRVSSGSAFYLVNTADTEKLHIICSIETSESVGWHTIESFFIVGGSNPTSVLSGFDHSTLSTAFNVSKAELHSMLTRQKKGPIIHLSSSDMAAKDEKQSTWSFKKLLLSMFGVGDMINIKTTQAPDSYNIYNKEPDFKNNYGWSIAVDESDYAPLMQDDVGVYFVNLTAGAMMAPHVNARATEYGIVLRGSGTIQIVYPNGSQAMNARVKEGDVFWVPRYFPFCQIASKDGPFELFGFTTSARNNRAQFLAGGNSLLHAMRGHETAAAFGVSLERLNRILDAQKETAILPPSTFHN